MAPVNNPKTKNRTQHRRKPYDDNSQSEKKLPGVQKIKSSLRQTQRLLAKDNLKADVRIQTERRLKALEKDLTQAEQAGKERTFAARYHKVKFFERQKVLRKIKQAKRTLETSEDQHEAEQILKELRIDLNYILHYPKSKKYMSLFPDSDQTNEATASERQQTRSWIQSCMDKGELSSEPEFTLEQGEKSELRSRPSQPSAPNPQATITDKQEGKRVLADESDDFFGDDDNPE